MSVCVCRALPATGRSGKPADFGSGFGSGSSYPRPTCFSSDRASLGGFLYAAGSGGLSGHTDISSDPSAQRRVQTQLSASQESQGEARPFIQEIKNLQAQWRASSGATHQRRRLVFN